MFFHSPWRISPMRHALQDSCCVSCDIICTGRRHVVWAHHTTVSVRGTALPPGTFFKKLRLMYSFSHPGITFTSAWNIMFRNLRNSHPFGFEDWLLGLRMKKPTIMLLLASQNTRSSYAISRWHRQTTLGYSEGVLCPSLWCGAR